MVELKKIPIAEANVQQLRYFASQVLGLEVAPTSNSATLLGKIEVASPGCTEITVDTAIAPAPETASATAPAPSKPTKAMSEREAGHFRFDPKVKVQVQNTNDKTRSKDVQIAVNGDVMIVKRGETVDLPYRFYLALRDAIETVGRETEEINPHTGMPIIEWVEQPSYLFNVLAMPSEEEIKAFHERTDALATV